MPYLAVRDIDICFDRAGTGAPLLAISGSRGDLRRKPNLLESPLAKAFDVLAYDQRGLGRTSKPDQPYSMSDYADDAAALMDAVGWERANIVGLSFGGMVALELAIRHPDRVAKLALCCTSPGEMEKPPTRSIRCRNFPPMSGRDSWFRFPTPAAMRRGRPAILAEWKNCSGGSGMIRSLTNRAIRRE
jgi:pimeloyl-ACP methyl ester carboxylesterase